MEEWIEENDSMTLVQEGNEVQEANSHSEEGILSEEPQVEPQAAFLEERLKTIKLHLDKKLDKLEKKLAENKWDVVSWASLLVECQPYDPIYVRDVYERAVGIFPSSVYFLLIIQAHVWIQYATYEYKNRNYKHLEAIFARCLKSILNLDLWKFYLSYVRQMNVDPSKAPTAEQKNIITKAYEFALSFIGLDVNSTSIWLDYLDFVRSFKTDSLYEEQQKMDLTRKIFQRAVCIPLFNVENLWKEYDSFENGLNKLTAKKILSDFSASYMKARSCTKELKAVYDSIERNNFPVPVSQLDTTTSKLEKRNVGCFFIID